MIEITKEEYEKLKNIEKSATMTREEREKLKVSRIKRSKIIIKKCGAIYGSREFAQEYPLKALYTAHCLGKSLPDISFFSDLEYFGHFNTIDNKLLIIETSELSPEEIAEKIIAWIC